MFPEIAIEAEVIHEGGSTYTGSIAAGHVTATESGITIAEVGLTDLINAASLGDGFRVTFTNAAGQATYETSFAVGEE